MSFLMMAHQESSTASAVLNAHTKRKGLSGPSQLTSEKLKILISTPTISTTRRCRVTAAFSQRKSLMLVFLRPTRKNDAWHSLSDTTKAPVLPEFLLPHYVRPSKNVPNH